MQLALLCGAVPMTSSTSSSPGEKLAALLREQRIQKAELGRRVGRDYLAVHRWTRDEQFTEKNRRLVCEALGLPLTFFEDSEQLSRAQSEARAREVFEAFCASPLGAEATLEERRILASVQFLDGQQPTVALYQAFLLAIRGHLTPGEVYASAEENAALDEAIARKSNKPD